MSGKYGSGADPLALFPPFPLSSNSNTTLYSSSLSDTATMSIAHGIRRAGVIGAGQMGTSWVAHALSLTLTLPCTGLGIAFVSAVHAKVPVLLHDRSSAQVKSGLALFDKILSKDVSKGKLTSEAAKEARDRVTVVDDLKDFRDADIVIEVSSLTFSLNSPFLCAL